jgi:hypothetical protein
MTEPTLPAAPSDAHEQGPAESAAGKTAGHAAPHAHAGKKKHKAHVHHKVAGRVRLRVPTAKGNPHVLEEFRTLFAAVPGITGVATNVETGSIVIRYDPKREAELQHHFEHAAEHHSDEHHVTVAAGRPGDEIEEMAKKIEAEAEFLAEHSEVVRYTVDIFKGLDYQIKSVTDNMIDLKIVLVTGLAVATFVEIGAEAATPMWVTLALFGVNHFIEMRHVSMPAEAAAAVPAPSR